MYLNRCRLVSFCQSPTVESMWSLRRSFFRIGYWSGQTINVFHPHPFSIPPAQEFRLRKWTDNRTLAIWRHFDITYVGSTPVRPTCTRSIEVEDVGSGYLWFDTASKAIKCHEILCPSDAEYRSLSRLPDWNCIAYDLFCRLDKDKACRMSFWSKYCCV